MRLNDRRQKLRSRSATGGHDSTWVARFHGASKREKSRTAFFEVTPYAHKARGFRPS